MRAHSADGKSRWDQAAALRQGDGVAEAFELGDEASGLRSGSRRVK